MTAIKDLKSFLTIFLLLIIASTGYGQELNINVKVNAPRVKNADPKVFITLEKELSKFFNNTKWTEDEFEAHEKIEGNINVNISNDISATSFSADISVQVIRPVYNSTYKTQILNYLDKGVNFTYQELQPIQNSFNNYIDPLSSLMTFYAYLILGYDYDTFSPFGGDTHFETARDIINNLPTNVSSGNGWDPKVKSPISRFNVINELLGPRLRPYRQAMHEYHIKSMDVMTQDAGKSRAVMLSAVTAIGQVNSSILNSGVLQMFADSKREELIEIFKGAAKGEQSKIYELMVKIDPARASEYNAIR